MGYKIKRIYQGTNLVRPSYSWTPDASRTLLYLPLESNITDQSGNSRSTSSTNVSFTTTGGLASASIPSSGYITIPDNMVNYSTTEGTVSCLLYMDTTSSSSRRCILWMLKNGTFWTNMIFKENTSNIETFTTGTGTAIQVIASSSYSANQWFHLVWTSDSSSTDLYVNGTKVATGTGTTRPRGTKTNTTNDSCRIGNSSNGSQGLAGSMREIILEKTKRSADDVSNYYTWIKNKLGF